VALMACASCNRAVSPTVFLDPALAVLVPPDTRLIAGIRMQRLLANPKFQAIVPDSRTYRSFREDTGLPLESTVWEYLLTYNGADWLVLMRGKFTEMGMEPRLDKPEARRVSVEGIPVFGDENGAIGFLNPTTAIAGKLDAVIRAVEGRNRTSGVPEPLEQMAKKIPSDNVVWFASTGPTLGFMDVERVGIAYGGFDPERRRMLLVVDDKKREEQIPDPVLQWLLGNKTNSGASN
jgi:hypothetical protein